MNEDTRTGLEIAIIGISGTFPGSKDLKQFFENLKYGVDNITFFDEEELKSSGLDESIYNKPGYVKAKGYLEDSEYFDYSFFGYTPNEAKYLDPQIRLMHEYTWKALEDAGYTKDREKELIGMYVGGRPHFLWELLSFADGLRNGVGDFELLHLNDKDLMSTRVSYKLNLKGPSVSLYTACSTSLVAVHMACQGLLSGECNMAVAGGVSVTVPEKNGYVYKEGLIMSPDGYCRAFDAKAGGTVGGNGIGLFVLKRLADAVKDGDHIYAVIKGSAINNDGNNKVGYTAPSVEGQADVIYVAQKIAEVDSESITYVECHGTATALGDPIELRALKKAFHTSKRNYCGLGSVKSNIGHLDSAAGAAGLMKVVLALQNGVLFPTLHFSKPNVDINFLDSPFYIVDKFKEWKTVGMKRRAAVSSFGVGGTNAHMILEEAPKTELSQQKKAEYANRIFLFSAKTKNSLDKILYRLKKEIKISSVQDFAAMEYTLFNGREDFGYRTYTVCKDRKELCSILSAGTMSSGYFDDKKEVSPLYFVFGKLDGNDSIENYKRYKMYDTTKDEFEALLEDYGEWSGISESDLLEGSKSSGYYGESIAFLFQLGLTKCLIKAGIKPAGLIGSGIGKYVAACIAGIISTADALQLVEKRREMLVEFEEQKEDIFLVESLQSEFYETLEDMEFQKAVLPIYSEVYSGEITEEISAKMETKDYWVNNLFVTDEQIYIKPEDRQTEKKYIYIVLDNEEHFGVKESQNVTSEILFMAVDKSNSDLEKHFLEKLGTLWLKGVSIKWNTIHSWEDKRRISLPVYEFDRKELSLDFRKIMDLREVLLEGKDVCIDKKQNDSLLYVPSWIRSEEMDVIQKDKRRFYVCLVNDNPVIWKCIEKLRQTGQNILIVRNGESFSLKEDHVTVNPALSNDMEDLFRYILNKIGEPDKILYFWSLDEDKDKKMKEEEVQNYCYYSLLEIAKAVGTLNITKNISMDVIGNGIFEVTGEEKVNPLKSLLLGPVKVITKEYPFLSCRLIDTEISDCHEFIDNLMNLIGIVSEENKGRNVIALRNRYYWKPYYQSVKFQHQERYVSDKLKYGGVYVITGGLGEIGLIIGKYLAEQYNATIVLIGRSTFLPEAEWDNWCRCKRQEDAVSRKINYLNEIKAAGKLVIKTADVADEQGILEALRSIQEEYGELNGIVHAAGIADGMVIQRRDRKMSEEIFQAKIYGTLAIQKAIEKLQLHPDFYMLFSSLSSILAPPAQVAYCSANAFLNAFAINNRKSRILTKVIDWDMWMDIGMSGRKFVYQGEKSGIAVRYQKLNHPMFYYRVFQSNKTVTYYSFMHADQDWFLNEHRVMGKSVLPGTAYIELAGSAYIQADEANTIPFQIQNVFFLAPLVVEDKVTVITTITRDNGKSCFTIESCTDKNDGAPICHAKGEICKIIEKPERYQIEEIKQRYAGKKYTQADYNDIRNSKLIYGPRWNCYSAGYFKDGGGLSYIEYEELFLKELPQYSYHPAVMDVALAYMDKSLLGTGQFAPFSYKSITIYGQLPKNVYSHIRLTTEKQDICKLMEFDLDVMDERGAVVVAIKGYKVAALTDKRLNDSLVEKKAVLQKTNLQRKKISGMSAEQGIEIFNTVLSSDCSQVIVSMTDLYKRIEKYCSEKADIYEKQVPDEMAEENMAVNVEKLSVKGIETIIIDIWKKVLGYEKIMSQDDFFILGGDSLKIITMAERIHKRLNIKIPITVYFSYTTAEKLAEYIKQNEIESNQAYDSITKTEEREYYQLSSGQKRLFFEQQSIQGNIAYNIPEVLCVEGELDVDRLQSAFERLIQHHRILRAGFDVIKGEIVSVIYEKPEFHIICKSVCQENVKTEIENFIQPFDLRIPPLLRVEILKLSEEKYIWLFDIHHIIADNIAVTILKNELIAIYNNEEQMTETEDLDYIDYIYWQNERIRKGVYKRQYDYWRKQLSGKLPSLALPTDYKRPAVLSHKGDEYYFSLDEDIHNKMVNVIKDETVTLYTKFMAAFFVLLYKYTGSEDLIVGESLAGRNHAELKEMVGMFANVLPLRVGIKGDMKFSTFLYVVKEKILEVFENQDVQLEVIIDELNCKRNPGSNPLFNVMVVMPDFNSEEIKMREIKLSPYMLKNKASKFDLTLWIYQYSNSLQLKIEYSTDLFTLKTIETIAEHLKEIISKIADDPDLIINDISIKSELKETDFQKSLFDTGDFAF